MRRVGLALRGLVLAIFCLVPFGSALAQIPSSVQIFMPNGGLPAAAIMMTHHGKVQTGTQQPQPQYHFPQTHPGRRETTRQWRFGCGYP